MAKGTVMHLSIVSGRLGTLVDSGLALLALVACSPDDDGEPGGPSAGAAGGAGHTTFRDAVPGPSDLLVPAFSGFFATHPIAGAQDADNDGTPEQQATYEYEGERLRRVTLGIVARPDEQVELHYLYACDAASAP
jgi:hypothetical protein